MIVVSLHFLIPLVLNHMMKHIQLLDSHQNTEYIWTLEDILHTPPVVLIDTFWLDIIFMVMKFLQNHLKTDNLYK